MTIRLIREDDAGAIADLNAQLGYPASEAKVAARIKLVDGSVNDAALVAANGDGRAIGWIHLRGFTSLTADPIAEICGLVVDAANRNRGIGTQLIAAAEKWAKTRGLGSMRVRSNAVRKDAHRFYERAGFEVTKTSLTFQKAIQVP